MEADKRLIAIHIYIHIYIVIYIRKYNFIYIYKCICMYIQEAAEPAFVYKFSRKTASIAMHQLKRATFCQAH